MLGLFAAGAFETFKTKVGVNEDEGLGGGGHNGDQGKGYNGDLEFSVESGGWKGSINNRARQGGGKNNGLGGQGGMGNGASWRGGETMSLEDKEVEMKLEKGRK